MILFFITLSLKLPAMELSNLEWTKRFVVISVINENDKLYKITNIFFKDNECKINDRDIQLIVFKNFKNKHFKKPEFIKNNYGIWLIGYDGAIKDFSDNESILFRIFNLIDTMPIRKKQILKNKS